MHSYCRKPVIGFTGDEHYRSLPADGAILGCLIAEREGKLCGIITDRDIALRVTGAKCDPDKTKVHD